MPNFSAITFFCNKNCKSSSVAKRCFIKKLDVTPCLIVANSSNNFINLSDDIDSNLETKNSKKFFADFLYSEEKIVREISKIFINKTDNSSSK